MGTRMSEPHSDWDRDHPTQLHLVEVKLLLEPGCQRPEEGAGVEAGEEGERGQRERATPPANI